MNERPFENVSHLGEPTPTFRCPCCRSRTLHGRGQDEICGVCLWQDDGQDDHNADEVRGGPNGHLSLADARSSFRKHGASSPSRHVGRPQPEEP